MRAFPVEKFVPAKLTNVPIAFVVDPLDITKLATLRSVNVPVVAENVVIPVILPLAKLTLLDIKLPVVIIFDDMLDIVDIVAVRFDIPIKLPPVICAVVAANVPAEV